MALVTVDQVESNDHRFADDVKMLKILRKPRRLKRLLLLQKADAQPTWCRYTGKGLGVPKSRR